MNGYFLKLILVIKMCDFDLGSISVLITYNNH